MVNKNDNNTEAKTEITNIADDLDLLTEIKPNNRGEIKTGKTAETAEGRGVNGKTDITSGEEPLDNDFIAETDEPPGKSADPKITGDPQEIINIAGDEFAGMIVTVSDLLQQKGFTAGYKKRLLSKDDRNRLKQLKAEQHASIKTDRQLNAYENWLLRIDTEIETYEETLPFSGEEKENLTNRLAAVMKGKNFKMTPEGALVSTAVLIALPRILPILLPDVEDRPFEDETVNEIPVTEKKKATVINLNPNDGEEQI